MIDKEFQLSAKILFRIPFTIYFLCWRRDAKLFSIVKKKFDSEYENLYFWHEV